MSEEEEFLRKAQARFVEGLRRERAWRDKHRPGWRERAEAARAEVERIMAAREAQAPDAEP